jgi:hypothetical protein
MLGPDGDSRSILDVMDEFLARMAAASDRARQLAANPANAAELQQLYEQMRASEAEFMARLQAHQSG